MTLKLDKSELAHYQRHFTLDEIGMEGQLKLKSASVLCVGAGGLGSPVLMYLASAGVGKLSIMDFDSVDVSNLQRQILYSYSDLGKSKAKQAATRLKEMNPNIEVDSISEKLTTENALDIISNYDLVIDGTDNFEARYLISDSCEILSKPHVFAAISEFEGQVSVFNLNDGPSYRDLYPEPPKSGSVKSCAESGVLGVLPGIIGSIQAVEALKVILKIGSPLSGRLLYFNALDMKFKEIGFTKNDSRIPVKKLIKINSSCDLIQNDQCSTSDLNDLSLVQFKKKVKSGWKPFVIDVRKPYESEIDRILDSVDLIQPHDCIAEKLESIPKDRDVVLFCASGKRSKMACETLLSNGFENIYNLDRGLK